MAVEVMMDVSGEEDVEDLQVAPRGSPSLALMGAVPAVC